MQSLSRHHDFSTWFSRPGRASFGHAKLTPESPIDQARHLYEETIKLTGDTSSLIVFAVADDLEGKLLLAELERKEPEFATRARGNLRIYDYATLYASLRRYDGIWQRSCRPKHITVICNVDIHYSAPFLLCMIYFMLWVRESIEGATDRTAKSSLRLLTLSDSDQVEVPLWLCMAYLLPPELNFRGITLSPTSETKTDFTQPVWSADENFVDTVLKNVYNYANMLQSTVVVCSRRQYLELFRGISDYEGHRPFDIVTSLDHSENRLLENCAVYGPDKTQPSTMFVLTTTSQLPLYLDNVLGVFIGDEADRANWEHGHIVHDHGPRSQREVRQAISYVYQSGIYRSGMPNVGVRLPSLDGLPVRPPSRVRSSDIWSFVAGLAILLDQDHAETRKMASYFMDNARFNTTLRQLKVMQFLDHREIKWGHYQMFFPHEKATQYLGELLPPLNHDFAAAWFLALGLADDQATQSAKRAMTYMAAISATEAFLQGLSSVFKKKDFYNVLSNAAEMPASGKDKNIANELSSAFEHCVSFPDPLWLQGGIWAQLAFLHTIYMADPTLSSTDAQNGKLVLADGQEIATRRAEIKGVMARVKRMHTRLKLNLLQDTPLNLDEHDCRYIQSRLSLAWRHCSFLVGLVQGELRILDMVTMASSSADQHPSDPLHIGLAIQSTAPTAQNSKMVLAVRHLERRKIENEDHLSVQDTVVLPLDVVGDLKAFVKSVKY